MNIDLTVLQYEVGRWADKNFGELTPSYHPLFGVVEELGELAHAHLKEEQKIREGEDQRVTHDMKKDAVGDVVIFLMHYCCQEGLHFESCLRDAWAEVSQRDWTKKRPAPFAGRRAVRAQWEYKDVT